MKTQDTVTGDTKTPTPTKYQPSPFSPRPSLLLDVVAAEKYKPVVNKPQAKPDRSPEDMLQHLLLNTETSARRTQFSRMKWQLATLVLLMLFIPTIIVAGWLYFEAAATGASQGRLHADNFSLKEQLNTAGIQITGLKGELDTLLNRNLELAGEVANLSRAAKQITEIKSQKQPAPAAPSSVVKEVPAAPAHIASPKPAAAARQSLDPGRIEAIRKGTYPNGATKDELIAVLGRPDRVYKSRNYEQFVYFSRKPGRFWFIGNWLVQTSN